MHQNVHPFRIPSASARYVPIVFAKAIFRAICRSLLLRRHLELPSYIWPLPRPILQPRRQSVVSPGLCCLSSWLKSRCVSFYESTTGTRAPRLLPFYLKNRLFHPTDILKKERYGIERLLLNRIRVFFFQAEDGIRDRKGTRRNEG